MKSLSTRELREFIGSLSSKSMREIQKSGGSISKNDLPIVITRYGKPKFILVDYDEYVINDYDNSQLEKYFQFYAQMNGTTMEDIIEKIKFFTGDL